MNEPKKSAIIGTGSYAPEKSMMEAGFKALEAGNLTVDDVDLCIPHQANKRIIDAVGERMGLPAEKVFTNIR